jgi:hypothetical protein
MFVETRVAGSCPISSRVFKVRNGLKAGDASEHERAQNRNRIRGRSVKIPGHLASRIEAGKRTVATQHLGLRVGR